jgi:hypothetical protein
MYFTIGVDMTMTLFGRFDRIMLMSAFISAVAVAMLVEEEKTENIRSEPETAHNKDEFRVGNNLRLDEALNGF